MIIPSSEKSTTRSSPDEDQDRSHAQQLGSVAFASSGPSFPQPSQHPEVRHDSNDTSSFYPAAPQAPPPAYQEPSIRSTASITNRNSPSSSSVPVEYTSNDSTTPPCFSRRPPPSITYGPFSPLFLINAGPKIKAGFPLCLPPHLNTGQAHPFGDHDVTEEDWILFLKDIREAGTLTERERETAGGVPILNMLPFIHIAVETAVKSYMKGKKDKIVSNVMDHWNHHFFNPRRIQTILMRGSVPVGGQFTDKGAREFLSQNTSTEADKTIRLFVCGIS